MDYSYILNSALPQKEKLLEFGFCDLKNNGIFVCKKTILNGDFYALVTLNISRGQLEVKVFETATDEKYALFDVPSACGAFVGEVRGEVQKLMEEIRIKCFVIQDIKQKYLDFLHSQFGACGDTPWADDGDATSTVFRCPNNKWFALVMKIKFRSLGFESDEPVWAVNLKADPDLILKVTDRKSIFPAYHMNKKYWLTVLLTAVTDFDTLCNLTEQSFKLVKNKK